MERPDGRHLFRAQTLVTTTLIAFVGFGAHCNREIPPPDDAITDPVEMTNVLVHRLADLQSARFRVVAEYYGGEMRGANFRQVVLVRQPEDIHVQTLSPFGQTLQILVSNGETLAFYDMEEEVFYSGAPTPGNLARLLPFYMTAGDIVSVLLGGPPLLQFHPETDGYELSWDGEEGRYTMSVPLANEDGRLELAIRHGDWTLAGAKRFDGNGDLIFELRTGDFEAVGDTYLPRRLRFLLEGENPVDMSIEAESLEINPSLPDELFVLEPPRGVEQRSLDY